MAPPGSLSGSTLDEKYRIDALLGRGGMGDVYLATHVGTGREVAVKVIGRDYMADETAVARFALEARAAGEMRHPNIVDVTDFGFAGGGDERVAYLVMERLIGETLRDRLTTRGRLPVREAVDVLVQVGAAVNAAHQRGIIHRDLKPENIWIERSDSGEERVKVLDFGLAKLRDVPAAAQPADSYRAPAVAFVPTEPVGIAFAPTERAGVDFAPAPTPAPAPAPTPAPTSAPPSQGQALTEVGVVMGTPLYMSPEQWMGAELDLRSDIYSMAVIAFEMIAGAPPFMGSPDSIGAAHLYTKAPSLASKAEGVPLGVASIIAQGLAKKPSERPPTADVFAGALRAATEGVGVLLLRAASICSKHSALLVRRTAIGGAPLVGIAVLRLLNRLLVAAGLVPERAGAVIGHIFIALFFVTSFLLLPTVSGIVAPLVADLLVVPRRAVRPPPRLADITRAARRTFVGSLVFTALAFVLPIGTRAPFLSHSLRVRLLQGLTDVKEISGQYVGLMVGLEIIAALIFAELTGRFAVFAGVAVVEGASGLGTLQRSAELTRHVRDVASRLQLVRTLFLGLASICVILVVSRILGAPIEDVAQPLADSIAGSVSFVVSAAVQAAFFPFFAVTFALFYLNTRLARGEALASVVPPAAISPDEPSSRSKEPSAPASG